MSRVCTIIAPVAAILLLSACGDSLKSKEKVQAAILERLQTKTGLNMSELDVSTTDVSFDKNMAYATVAIHPKGDTNVTHGMAMKYTLQEQGNKWVVVNAGGPKLGGPAQKGPDGAALPPGHPTVAPGQSMPPGMTMPEGHPGVAPPAGTESPGKGRPNQ